MIYSNLLIFLTVIFLFSIDSVPDEPLVPWFDTLLITVGSFVLYLTVCRRMFRRSRARSSAGYFVTERNMSILALVFFALLLFFGDIKYYFSFLSFGDRFPVFVNVAGLVLFMGLLSVMWWTARRSYFFVFGRQYGGLSFLSMNIKSNLPIVLPWIALSLVYDLLLLAPFDGVAELLDSEWGDLVFYGFFLVFVMLLFPPLVKRLWGCTRLPEGVLKDHLMAFCRRQNFNADIYIWPLFEGRMLTAGVMGLVPGLRYILLTPAIIETMTVAELEAVMAHEIGHVKKKHLLLYVLLIGGFSLLVGMLAEPILYYAFSLDWVVRLLLGERMSQDSVMSLVGGVPVLIMLLLYFRFVFGYFIRNFERQADVYVISVLGNARPLISAFDKIVDFGGQSRDKPNWHHFGIGERIEYLQRCEKDPAWIGRHNKKVWVSLVAYVLIFTALGGVLRQVPTEQMARDYQRKYIELVLMDKSQDIEDKALWFRLVGDLMLDRNLEDRALVAYEKALEIDPDDAELQNNLAWLLLTSNDPEHRDPKRALELARKAVDSSRKPHVLDTLATALWANGMVAEAVRIESEALQGATSQKEFYQRQVERFGSERYGAETRFKD